MQSTAIQYGTKTTAFVTGSAENETVNNTKSSVLEKNNIVIGKCLTLKQVTQLKKKKKGL